VYDLAISDVGLQLLSDDDDLRSKITIEGLNAACQDNCYKGDSAILRLAATPAGCTILANDDILRAKISSEGLNRVCEAGERKAESAITWLATTPEGRLILAKDSALCEKISLESFNKINFDKQYRYKNRHSFFQFKVKQEWQNSASDTEIKNNDCKIS
jgi:hypothetical protein